MGPQAKQASCSDTGRDGTHKHRQECCCVGSRSVQRVTYGLPLIGEHSLGVIGLSTAIRLREKGYDVTIIAESFPTDPRSIKYTSPWAVGTHRAFSVLRFNTDHDQGAYHTLYLGGDQRLRCMFSSAFSSAREAYCSDVVMRDDTLKVMLELSAPGGSAEGCMRRLQSIEYFLEDIDPTTYEPTFQVSNG